MIRETFQPEVAVVLEDSSWINVIGWQVEAAGGEAILIEDGKYDKDELQQHVFDVVQKLLDDGKSVALLVDGEVKDDRRFGASLVTKAAQRFEEALSQGFLGILGITDSDHPYGVEMREGSDKWFEFTGKDEWLERAIRRIFSPN